MSGAGCVSLLAYRLSPDEFCSSAAHGLTQSGQFIIAAHADSRDPITSAPAGRPIDVRVDLLKESPEPAVRLVAATVHLLGQLTWLDPDETFLMLVEGALPPQVAEIAENDAGRVGVIQTDRVVLRDSLGVTPIDFSSLVRADRRPRMTDAAYPNAEDEWDAYDLVASVDEAFLRQICCAVDEAAIAGTICWRKPTTIACEHTLGRVFLADVDRTGVTLMSVEPDKTLTAFAAFRHTATTLDDLAVQMSCLIEDAISARSPRI